MAGGVSATLKSTAAAGGKKAAAKISDSGMAANIKQRGS